MSVAARREREREARRHHILDAAQRVFYARGFDLATMDDVALEAQLGKGTLYLYFRTKEDLLAGVASRQQLEIIQRFEEQLGTARPGIDQVRGMLLAYANLMAHPHEHLKMAVSRWAQATPLSQDATCASNMREHAMRIFGLMREAVEQGQSDGSVRSDVPAARLVMHLWGGVNGALLLRLKLGCVSAPNPLSSHLPELAESIDLLLESARALR